jgi:hypothetical protein
MLFPDCLAIHQAILILKPTFKIALKVISYASLWVWEAFRKPLESFWQVLRGFWGFRSPLKGFWSFWGLVGLLAASERPLELLGPLVASGASGGLLGACEEASRNLWEPLGSLSMTDSMSS